jgi:isoamylase
MGRTQGGNNNAYCQDNDISWFHWDAVDTDLLDFAKTLIRLRRENPALRPIWFRRAPDIDDVTDWVQVLRADGAEFTDEDWDNPEAKSIMFALGHTSEASFALLLNAAENGVEFTIPKAPNNPWQLAASSDPEQVVQEPVSTLIVRDTSFTLLESRPLS